MTPVRPFTEAATASRQHVHPALVQMLREALSELSSLKREVAELRTVTEAIGYRERPARDVPQQLQTEPTLVMEISKRRDTVTDFDWEAWAREKRARIRGLDTGSTAGSSAA